MSSVSVYSGPQGTVRVALPFDLAGLLAGWKRVRSAMREIPAEFTRDEWAYLASYRSERPSRAGARAAFSPGHEGESRCGSPTT